MKIKHAILISLIFVILASFSVFGYEEKLSYSFEDGLNMLK